MIEDIQLHTAMLLIDIFLQTVIIVPYALQHSYEYLITNETTEYKMDKVTRYVGQKCFA